MDFNKEIVELKKNLMKVSKNEYSDVIKSKTKIAHSIFMQMANGRKISDKQKSFIVKYNEDIEFYPFNSVLHQLVWDIRDNIAKEMESIEL
jgi:hypothetical protein